MEALHEGRELPLAALGTPRYRLGLLALDLHDGLERPAAEALHERLEQLAAEALHGRLEHPSLRSENLGYCQP